MKKQLFIAIFAMLMLPTMLMAQAQIQSPVVRYDGHTYNTVPIGTHYWMTENLQATHNAAGQEISHIYTYGDVNTYGRLYCWYAAMNVTEGTSSVTPDENQHVQGICPDGWYLPSTNEMNELKANKLSAIHATTLWQVPGNNRTGLTIIPNGYYNYDNNAGDKLNMNAYLWTAVDNNAATAKAVWTDCYCNMMVITDDNPANGMAVRCVTTPMSITTDSVTSLTGTSATLNGTTDLAGRKTMIAGFKYGLSSTAMNSTVKNNSFCAESGRYTCNIENLNPLTKYYYVAYMYNDGEIVYGDTLDFTTYTIHPCEGMPVMKDANENEYLTVKIGTQCWMAQNLRTKLGTDGDKGYPTSAGADSLLYGRLYTWSAMMKGASSTNYPVSGDKVQGICPTGWHVPSYAEWTALTDYVNSEANEFRCEGDGNIAKALSSKTGWNSSTSDGCNAGNVGDKANATSFSAVPAGFFNGEYRDFGYRATFWSATQYEAIYAHFWSLTSSNSSVITDSVGLDYGLSVRCLCD